MRSNRLSEVFLLIVPMKQLKYSCDYSAILMDSGHGSSSSAASFYVCHLQAIGGVMISLAFCLQIVSNSSTLEIF